MAPDPITPERRRFPLRLPRPLWVPILLALCIPRFSESSTADDELPPDREQKQQSPLPEPWRIIAEWRGSRGGGSQTSTASDGRATWKSESGRHMEIQTEAPQRLRIAQHARTVIRRFQLGGHRVEDGVTSTWSISAGSATVELRDQGGDEVSIPVMDLRDFANARGIARRKAALAGGADGPDERDRSLKSGGKGLLPESAYENNFRVVVTLGGKGSLQASTVSLDESGTMVLAFRANRTFDNNLRFKADIQKLLDAVAKYARPEEPPRD